MWHRATVMFVSPLPCDRRDPVHDAAPAPIPAPLFLQFEHACRGEGLPLWSATAVTVPARRHQARQAVLQASPVQHRAEPTAQPASAAPIQCYPASTSFFLTSLFTASV